MKSKDLQITKEELLHLFDYDREKGIFIWKNPPLKNGYLKNKIAGSKTMQGYVSIRLKRRNLLVHRLVWLIEKGTNVDQLDHINGIRSDNRIENLRAVTNRLNQNNTIRHRNGRLVGATYHKNTNKYMSRLKIKGKNIHLGLFNTEIEAHIEYKKMLKFYLESGGK